MKGETTYNEVIKGSKIFWIIGFSCIPLGIICREIPSLCLGFWAIGGIFVFYPIIKYGNYLDKLNMEEEVDE